MKKEEKKILYNSFSIYVIFILLGSPSIIFGKDINKMSKILFVGLSG